MSSSPCPACGFWDGRVCEYIGHTYPLGPAKAPAAREETRKGTTSIQPSLFENEPTTRRTL